MLRSQSYDLQLLVLSDVRLSFEFLYLIYTVVFLAAILIVIYYTVVFLAATILDLVLYDPRSQFLGGTTTCAIFVVVYDLLIVI